MPRTCCSRADSSSCFLFFKKSFGVSLRLGQQEELLGGVMEVVGRRFFTHERHLDDD